MKDDADTLTLAGLVLRLRTPSHAHSWAAADALMQLAAEQIERLQGERRVLVDVLRECDAVLQTLQGECTDEQAALERLLLTVKRVTLLGLHDGLDAQQGLPLGGPAEGRPC